MRLGNEIDLTETNINIDALLDVYVTTQKSEGKDPELVERNITVDDKGNVVVIPVEEETVTEQKETVVKEKEKGQEFPWWMKNKLGFFEDHMSAELDDEEGDGPYICEYCSDIGYQKKYKSYLCDTCDSCSTCAEFNNAECDGCGYSVYRNGKTYSEQLMESGDDSFLEDDEKEIISSIESGEYDDEKEIKQPDLGFSIMDYDHKY